MKFRYVMIILILLLLVGAASAWLPGYDYRRGHQILGSTAGHQTDYPVKFIVHRGEGGCNLGYVSIDAAKCNADFSDIRFTGSDETTPLNYWIESVSDSNATIWVEVPYIDQSAGATVYIYYGNSSADNESNGDATFLMFDDFSGSVVDSGKWTGADAYHEVSGGELILKPGAGTAKYLKSLTNINQRIAIEYRFRQASGLLYFVGINHGDAINTPCIGHVTRTNYESAVGKAYSALYLVPGRTTSSSNTDGTIISDPGTSWQRMALLEKSGTIDALQDSSLYSYEYAPTTSGKVVIHHYSYASGVNGYIDWIVVRSYADPEPEHSTWSEEQDNIPEDNIIMPSEMPFVITTDLVAEVGNTFIIGGDKTFDDSATYAVSIQAPDIVLDGGHYTLTGTLDGSPQIMDQNAIVVSGVQNVTVFNVHATGWNHGILYENVESGWISQNNIYGNCNHGIGISLSSGLFIEGNILQNNGENGLYVADSRAIRVIPSLLGGGEISYNTGNGIVFRNVTESSIERCPDCAEGHISHNNKGVFVFDSQNISIIDFRIYENTLGIGFENTHGVLIKGNIVSDNTLNNVGITNSQDVLVHGNGLVRGSGDSLGIYDSNIVTLTGNYVEAAGSCGMDLGNITSLTVQANTLDKTSMSNGLNIYNSSDIGISMNIISNSSLLGVFFVECSEVLMNNGNTIKENGWGGVAIADTDYCTLDNNIITNNNGGGIALGGQKGCSHILLSHNTINDTILSGSYSAGISASTVENFTISQNTITNNGVYGIDAYNCRNLTVNSNEISDHLSSEPSIGSGISICNSFRADTFGNTLNDNRIGIIYRNTTFNHIWNNIVTNEFDVEDTGIAILEGSGMTGDFPNPSGPPYSIMRNQVTRYQTGLFLENVTDLLIFDNYFSNPANFGIGAGTSGISWNLTEKELQESMTNIIGGQYFGGNFWGQPDGWGYSQTAGDADHDGICDLPYELGETGYTDSLPLGGFEAYFIADPTDAVQYGEDPVTIQFYDGSTGYIDSRMWDFGDGEIIYDEQNPIHEFVSQGAFYVNLRIENTATGVWDEYGTWIYIRPAFAPGVPIWPGWNFVSVPRTLAGGSDTVATVFEGVQTGGQMVYSYNSSTHAWVAMLPPDDDKILPLDGIWIYSTQFGPFVEFNYSSDFGQVVPRIKHLEPGWNAIGMGSLYPMDTTSYLASLGDKWDVLLDFNDQLQTYYPPQIRGRQWGGMYPTEGYWIYMNEAGDLLAVTG